MKYLNLITATALALSSVGCQHDVVGPARVTDANFAAVSSTEVVERVIATTKFVPCANGGLGEDVSLSGNFHDTIHATLDESGGAHVLVMHAPQGVSGTGLTTGTTYHGVGAFIQDASNVKIGEEHTSVVNQLIIGEGPGNNLTLHSEYHVSISPAGAVTSFHDNIRIECR
jgi:hypothetical protein